MSLLQKIGKVFAGGSSSAAAASRSVARDRLSVILASQRGSELLAGVDMELLQRDVMEVVQKHLNIAKNRPVNFHVNAEGEVSFFEMTVELAMQHRNAAAHQSHQA